jgi:hypothetical protein
VKKILLLTALLISNQSWAVENPYSFLFPKNVLSWAGGNEIARQVEKVIEDYRPDLKGRINGAIARKESLTANAKIRKDACNKNIDCLNRVHQDLKEALNKVHSEIRELTDQLALAHQTVIPHLAGVLNQTLLAVVAGEFVFQAKNYAESHGITMETDLVPEFLTDRDEVVKFVSQPVTWSNPLNAAINGGLFFQYFYRDQHSETAATILLVSIPMKYEGARRVWVPFTANEQYARSLEFLTNPRYQTNSHLEGVSQLGELVFVKGASNGDEFQLLWEDYIGGAKVKHDRVDF